MIKDLRYQSVHLPVGAIIVEHGVLTMIDASTDAKNQPVRYAIGTIGL